MSGKKVVILGGAKASTDIIYNSLKTYFDIFKVIVEEAVPTRVFLKRRIKRLGAFKVFGQVLFQLFVIYYLNLTSKRRILDLKERYHFDETPIEEEIKEHVTSVNSDETIMLLKEI